jgi:hypothetical protein
LLSLLGLGLAAPVSDAQVWKKRTRANRVASAMGMRAPVAKPARRGKAGKGRRPVRGKKKRPQGETLIIEESSDSDDPRSGSTKPR